MGPPQLSNIRLVGYALADARASLSVGVLAGRRACPLLDGMVLGEPAVRVITDLMHVVGIDSFDDELPLCGHLQDAITIPVYPEFLDHPDCVFGRRLLGEFAGGCDGQHPRNVRNFPAASIRIRSRQLV